MCVCHGCSFFASFCLNDLSVIRNIAQYKLVSHSHTTQENSQLCFVRRNIFGTKVMLIVFMSEYMHMGKMP